MSSAFSIEKRLYSAGRVLLVLVLLASAIVGWRFIQVFLSSKLPVSGISAPDWRKGPESRTEVVWSALSGRDSSSQTGTGSQGALASRLRLAGTFFFEDGAGTVIRKAVIDDLKSGIQHITTEGQSLGDVLIVTVFQDHVLVRTNDGVEDNIWLNLTGQGSKAAGQGEVTETAGAELEYDRFGGARLGENRWVYSRAKLLEYYAELMNEPERLLKVCDSLAPEWTPDGKINGYRLKVEGEGDFFSSIGFQESDVVRSVNTMPMSSRRRAEYFIKEFAENRLNVVMIDIERDGKPQRLTYELH